MPRDAAPAHPELADLLRVTIAQACNLEPASVTGAMSMLELGLDSLTLVSVLAQLEAVYGLELTGDETLPLLEAATVGALIEHLEAVFRAAPGPEP